MRIRLIAIFLSTFATAACGAQASAASVVVSGDIAAAVPRTRDIVDLGRAPAAAPLAIAVTLHYRNESELDRLVALQSDPASPLFRHFLSNAQFDAAFAPARADYARVISALQSGGFRITQTYDNDTVVDAVGTVAAANAFFATDVHSVDQRGYGVRFANALPARVPAGLRGLIDGVTGLQTLRALKPAYARIAARPGAFVPAAAPAAVGPPLYGPVSTMTGYGGYGPLAFSQGYDLPDQHSKNGRLYDGAGRRSGIVIDADFLDSDLTSFLAYFKLRQSAPKTVRVMVDGGPPRGDASPDSIEATLDAEALVSNALGTKLYVYEFPSFDNDRYITDAYNRVVSDNFVDTANSSFGGCETVDAAGARTWDRIAEQGAAKGITFHASTGDDGSDSCYAGTNTISAPASGPHFAAIGGTSLIVGPSGTWLSEATWNDSSGASTGGVSKIFPEPAWQATLAGTVRGGRNVPDVSFDADPNTGMAFFYGGSWNSSNDPIGGTSLSSPLYGAGITDADEVIGGRSGLAAVTAYRLLLEHGYNSAKYGVYFHDVITGCNATTSAGFCARKGYDEATGIGSIVWWHYLE